MKRRWGALKDEEETFSVMLLVIAFFRVDTDARKNAVRIVLLANVLWKFRRI